MRLSDFNRYAGDFDIRRQGSNDSQALKAQGIIDRQAEIEALNTPQQIVASSTSVAYDGLHEPDGFGVMKIRDDYGKFG